jgi:hypothetical protein
MQALPQADDVLRAPAPSGAMGALAPRLRKRHADCRCTPSVIASLRAEIST